MATNFYKVNGSYYTTTGQKINNLAELQSYAKAGGKEVSAPTQTASTPVATNSTNLNTTALGNAGVNSLFKLYYGRNATSDELNYWSTKSDAELRPKLIPNSATELARNTTTNVNKTVATSPTTTNNASKQATLYNPENGNPVVVDIGSKEASELQNVGYTLDKKSTTTENATGKTEQTQAEKDAAAKKAAEEKQMSEINTYIDSLGLDDSQKQILKYVAQGTYATGNKVYSSSDVDKLLSDAATNASTDLNPYYTTQTAQEIEDLKNKYSDIRNQSARYTQQEQKSYAQKLADTKQSLRASGLTFSGANRKTLGGESAINSQGVEGTVPQQRRYDIEDANATIQQSARDAGIAAERKLGSAAVSNIQSSFGTMSNPYASGTTYNPNATKNLYEANQQGTTNYVGTGTLELDRLKALEESKWNRLKSMYK